MIKPSLSLDGGEAFKLALLLLAPIKAALTQDEQIALFDLIKASSTGRLEMALDSMEVPNAMCATGALLTRHGALPGVSEASEMVSLAARYADAGYVMPPEAAQWKKAWYIAMWPSALESTFDTIEDGLSGLTLQRTSEYDAVNPPSPMVGNQSAGYREGLYKVLTHNIASYAAPVEGSEAGGGE